MTRKLKRKKRGKPAEQDLLYYTALKKNHCLGQYDHTWNTLHRGMEDVDNLSAGHLHILIKRIERKYKITEYKRHVLQGIDMSKLANHLKPLEQLDTEAWLSPIIVSMRRTFNKLMIGLGRKKRL